ncbi:MAG: hypothetical protein WAO71_06500 [Gallionella sp.]
MKDFMMTIKAFAYSAQQHLRNCTGNSIKHSHIYELLAALFGFKSFAAFTSDAFFADKYIGADESAVTAKLIGRLVQLKYPQAISMAIAQCLADYAQEKSLSFIRKDDLSAMLTSQKYLEERDDEFEDWEEENTSITMNEQIDSLFSSALLIEELEQAAEKGDANAHFMLAQFHSCEEPSNNYLYEESLKGRVLTHHEQIWVAEYIEKKAYFKLHFGQYEYHLRQAAQGGIRQAATELAGLLNDPKFFSMAEQGTGSVNAKQMLRLAHILGNIGSQLYWLRITLEEDGSLDEAEAEILNEEDNITTMHAYHDGGSHDGELYDDDVGGSLYVV